MKPLNLALFVLLAGATGAHAGTCPDVSGYFYTGNSYPGDRFTYVHHLSEENCSAVTIRITVLVDGKYLGYFLTNAVTDGSPQDNDASGSTGSQWEGDSLVVYDLLSFQDQSLPHASRKTTYRKVDGKLVVTQSYREEPNGHLKTFEYRPLTESELKDFLAGDYEKPGRKPEIQ